MQKTRIRDRRRREKRRQDPAAHAAYCEKERLRNQKRKEEGVQLKFKKSEDLTEREWRGRQKQQKIWNSNRNLKNGVETSGLSV